MPPSPAAAWFCPHCLATGPEVDVAFCPHDGVPVKPALERGAEWIGQTLAGRYRIERFLGAGGCAEVYVAAIVGSDRQVAVKLLNAAFAATPGAADRFRQEAQLISLVAHPNVVAIQDYGTSASGAPFMVMELLEGESLGSRLASGPLSPVQSLRLALQMCEGLAAAHERGVIHRDIKPDNLFLVPRGTEADPAVKILDLGIAKLFGPTSSQPRFTLQGTVAGTPEYMSPEQATAGHVGPQSDVYSLGCVLWEMLLGNPPFHGGHFVTVLARHVGAELQWPSDVARERGVPAGAESLLRRTLAKEPAKRPATMLDLQAEIAGLVGRSRFGSRRTDPAPGSNPQPPSPAPPVVTAPVLPKTLARVPLVDARSNDDAIVEIAADTYWVGRRRGVRLECNPYLRRFRGNDREISVLIDPGGLTDFEAVAEKVTALLGNLERLDYVFLNHQDPDVGAAAPLFQQRCAAASLLTSQDTWRLVQSLGLDPARYVSTESLLEGELRLPTGHRLLAVPTPFCHFRGATMLYDPDTRVLFSGDLFGGTTEVPGLVASEASWPGIELFHQIYMPSNRALRAAVAKIRALEPAPRVIAPQHGGVLLDGTAAWVLDRVAELPVGLDLPDETSRSGAPSPLHAAAANEILDALALLVGEEAATELVRRYAADGSFSSPFVLKDGREIADFRVEAEAGLARLTRDVLACAPPESKTVIERVIRRALEHHGIAAPSKRPRSDREAGYRQVFDEGRETPPIRTPRRP